MINISNRHKHLPEDVAVKLDNFINLMNNIALEHSERLKNKQFDEADQCQYDAEIIKAEYKNLRSKFDINYKHALQLIDAVVEPVEGDRYKTIVSILKTLGYSQKSICHEALINPCLLSQHMRDRQELSSTNKNKLRDFAYKVAIGVMYAN